MATNLRNRIRWMFHASTTRTDRRMQAFEASRSALGRACEANRPIGW